MPASSCSRSSRNMRDRPSEAARNPAACGTRSSRAVSAARTIIARRSSASECKPELLDHGVEGAALAAMAPEHVVDVERNRRETDRRPPVTSAGSTNRNTAERIDEAADQPGTGDPIHLRPGPRDPDRAALVVAAPASCLGRDQKPFGVAPGFEPAFEEFGGDALVAQPGSDALRKLLSFLANDDDLTSGELACPARRRS